MFILVENFVSKHIAMKSALPPNGRRTTMFFYTFFELKITETSARKKIGNIFSGALPRYEKIF